MQHYCEIPTPKGIMRGFFHKPNVDKHPVCLIFHGFTGQKTGTKFCYVQLARMLEARGIATFRFDFLGSGESDLNFKDMTFKDELACARIILEETLKMDNCTKVYVLGHSMGGAVASELAKLYPEVISKLDGLYDHGGFEISQAFVDDILSRDFYQNLDIYKNELLVIHGTEDKTVPFDISNIYLPKFNDNVQFVAIEGANHNYDTVEHIKKVLKLSLDFLVNRAFD